MLSGEKRGQGENETTVEINPMFLPLSGDEHYFIGLSKSVGTGAGIHLALIPAPQDGKEPPGPSDRLLISNIPAA